jgi:hypothetical protein
MTSPRWSTLISGLVLVLSLSAGGDARAQLGFEGVAGPAWGGQFGVTYGNGFGSGFSPYGSGFSPYGFGSYGMGYGGFGSFPMPGFAESLGLIPQTTIAFPGLSSGITAVPGWDGPVRSVPRQRVRRRR